MDKTERAPDGLPIWVPHFSPYGSHCESSLGIVFPQLLCINLFCRNCFAENDVAMLESNRVELSYAKKWNLITGKTKNNRTVYVVYYTFASSIGKFHSKLKKTWTTWMAELLVVKKDNIVKLQGIESESSDCGVDVLGC